MRPKNQAELPLGGGTSTSSAEAKALKALCESTYEDGFLPVLKNAVDRYGPKEAAWLFDVAGSYMSDALSPRVSDKYARVEWLVALLVAAPDATRAELLGALCRIAGYKAPVRKIPLTAEQENEARKRAIAKLAPGLVEAIEREVDGS